MFTKIKGEISKMKMNENRVWDLDSFECKTIILDIANHICRTMTSDENKIMLISERLRIDGILNEDWEDWT